MRYWRSKEHELEFVLSENSEIAFEKHNHNSNYVVGLVLQGNVQLEAADSYMCTSEDIFIIPKDEVHVVRLLNSDAKLLSMCIKINYLAQHDLKTGEVLLNEVLTLLIQDGIVMKQQADALCDAFHMVYEMYMTREKEQGDEILKIKNLMITQPELPWNLEELSKEIFISKYYMIRMFKDRTGLTPHCFHIQNRIRKAQQLLQQGWKVIDVAAEMGFYDQSHFDKAFRKIVGISPNEYQESIHWLK